MNNKIAAYLDKIKEGFTPEISTKIEILADTLLDAWRKKRNVYICGNGGSAGNATHLANDFNYGIDKDSGGIGLRIESLAANSSVLTCIANDEGYENIFAQQLLVKANEGDVLIVLSGSGNSSNILKALEVANGLKMKTFAILGFSGGKAKTLAQQALHFKIDDMQVSEDVQMIVGHILMQVLLERGKN